jgi:hypothetical protein
MQTLKAHQSVVQTREAGEISRLARRIGVPAGLERSFKIAAGGIDASRFLISMGVRPGFHAALNDGLKSLHFPDALRPGLEQALHQTRFLHLGYEEPKGEPVCKLYCESAPAAERTTRMRMHTAFKWQPRDPKQFACDEYWQLGDLTEAELRGRVAASLPQGPVLAALEGLVDRALTRVPVRDLFFLEVTRNGAPRSFDLKLYDAGLNLDDARDLAAAAAGWFEAGDIAPILAEHGGSNLGHVSAAPAFLTLYYGAEAMP